MKHHTLSKRILATGLAAVMAMPSVLPVAAEGESPLDFTPPTPTISKFAATGHETGWYHLETNLQIGDSIYSFDYNTTGNEVKSENPDDYRIASVPEKFIGCDFIVTRRVQRKRVAFLTERDIDVYAAIDTAYGTAFSWESGWTRTTDTLTTRDGREYALYRRSYAADQQVTISAFGGNGDTGRNLFYMILPSNGLPITQELTKNPALPEGERSEEPTGNTYRYYLQDVYNTLTGDGLPTGYTTTGSQGTAAIVTVSETPESEPIIPPQAGTNMALGRPFKVSGDTWRGESPVDGDPTTYWESQTPTESEPALLTVDLGHAWKINEVKIKLWPRWGDRVQRLAVQGSTDGTTYTTLVEAAEYTFVVNDNVVTIALPETKVRHLRLVGLSNTGNDGVQVGELEVYGPEQDPVEDLPVAEDTALPERILSLDKKVASTDDWGVVRRLDEVADGQIVVETRVKLGAAAQKNILSLETGAGEQAVSLVWDADGILRAVSADNTQELTPYTVGEWTTVKLVLDYDRTTYDVWVDHLLKADDLPLPASADLKEIGYLFDADSTGTMQVDYLSVYDDTEIYAIADDFNALATDSKPTEWSYSDEGSVKVAEVPFAEDKSLQLTGTGVYAVRGMSPLTGHVTVEAMVKATNDGWVTVPLVTDGEGRVAAKVALYQNSVFVSDGNNWAYVCDQVTPHAYYEAGNWYQIRLVMNTDTRRYDVYIDGAKRYAGAAFAEEADAIERISFGTEEANTLYVDDVKVYNSASLAGDLMPGPVFNVKDFGAVGDGVADDTAAIAKAIKAATGTGGTVLLEDGVFYTGQVTLASDMTLFIAPDATIFANMDRHAYDKVIPSNGYNGNKQLGRGVIYFDDAKNVRITGGGTINGNGIYAYGENDPADQRPCLLYFTQCENVTVENVHMIHSPFWTLVPYESRGVTIRHVDITNHIVPNRDGIDPVNCRYMTIENCQIIAGDDAICPKSGNQIESSYLEVRDCLLQSDCNGIKIGTDTQGPIHDMLFEDICIKKVGLSGITVQSVDGSDIERLEFSRIDMHDVDNALFVCIGNRYRMPIPATGSIQKLGTIRDLVFEDISYTDPMTQPYSLYDNDNIHEMMVIGLNPDYNTIHDGMDHLVSDVLFKNVYLEMPGGATTVPEWTNGISNGYPEHQTLNTSTGWAYTLRWTENVRFVNCQSVALKEDVRQEIAIADSVENTAQTALRMILDEGEALRSNPSYSTADEALRQALETALASAWGVYEDNNATDAACNRAATTLQTALKGLGVVVQVDKNALQAEVEAPVTDLDRYTTKTANAYKAALLEATALLNDPDATQVQVNKALQALLEAKAALEIDLGRDPLADTLIFGSHNRVYTNLLYGWMFYTDWKAADNAPGDMSGLAANGANQNMALKATVTFTALHDDVDVTTAWKKIGFRLRSSHVDGQEKAAGFYDITPNRVEWGENNRFEVEIPLSAINAENINWADLRELNVTCELYDEYCLTGSGDSPDMTFALENVRVEVMDSVFEVDRILLNAAIKAAEAITDLSGYTDASKAVFQQALAHAKAIAANVEATQDQVDAAADALIAAQKHLTERAEITAGDVDGNGSVEANDALLALQVATGKIDLTEEQQQAADVDGTPGITAGDALLILQYATRKIMVFPVTG